MGIVPRSIRKTASSPQTELHSTATQSIETRAAISGNATTTIAAVVKLEPVISPADNSLKGVIPPAAVVKSEPIISPADNSLKGVTSITPELAKTVKIQQDSPIKLPIDKSVTSLKIPPFVLAPPKLLQYEARDPVKDSYDLEKNVRTDSSTAYDLSGVKTSMPVIVYSADFVPIYEGDKLNDVGRALLLKEASKQLTFAVSSKLMTLSGMKALNKLVVDARDEVKRYAETRLENLKTIIGSVNNAYDAINLRNYKYNSTTGKVESVDFFTQVLNRMGQFTTDEVSKYSATKLWQQSLLELKRILLAHSQGLIDNKKKTSDEKDEEPYRLVELEKPPSGLKRIWINPYALMQDVSTMSDPSSLNQAISDLTTLSDALYVNLANPEKFTKYEISTLQESGRDISLIINAVNKEKVYSQHIKAPGAAKNLKEEFGYQVSTTGDNFAVWDYLVGRFSPSVLDAQISPTGNGKSLVSFSQETIKEGNSLYNVLTFEDAFLQSLASNQVVTAASTLTPGTYYYIDSSLSSGGKRFDTSRIDSFLNKINNANGVITLILGMIPPVWVATTPKLGKDTSRVLNVDRWLSVTSNSSSELLNACAEELSGVYSVYSKCVVMTTRIQDQALGTHSLASDSLRDLSIKDNIGYRLASLICKTAVSPKEGYKSNSSKIKSLLFIWLMNVILQKRMINALTSNTEKLLDNPQHIQAIKDLIVKELSISSVELSKEEFNSPERLFPISVEDGDISVDLLNVTKFAVANSSNLKDGGASSGANVSGDAKSSQAYQNYINSASNSIFKTDADGGIWGKIVDILEAVYENKSVYLNDNGSLTGYSGMSKTTYLFAFFDLILRVIAAQTPENLLGVYRKSSDYSYRGGSIKSTEIGFAVDKPGPDIVEKTYDFTVKNSSVTTGVKKIRDAIAAIFTEETLSKSALDSYQDFIKSLSSKMKDYKDFLTNSTNFPDEYGGNNNLFNASLSSEQMIFSKYMSSETRDKINSTGSSGLKFSPPSGYEKFLPFDDFSLTSFSRLREIFKNAEYGKTKGNNKKILSIGIPPKLFRSLTPSSRDFEILTRENIVRLKVYKIDRLHLGVVYKPQEFLFQMNRFPTKVSNKWKDWTVKQNLPTRVITHGSEDAEGEGGNTGGYLSFLGKEAEVELHKNHLMSFALEEYMRWFTDCNFDETRYHRYFSLSNQQAIVSSQYNSLTGSIEEDMTTVDSTLNPNTSNTNISLSKGNSKPLLVAGPSNNTNTSTSTTKVDVDLTNSVATYFREETYVLGDKYFKRRLAYPKKFDRVFNILIDPDDFILDKNVPQHQMSLQLLEKQGVLIKQNSSNSSNVNDLSYKHRDTTQEDVYFDEYFVTMEPYDFGVRS